MGMLDTASGPRVPIPSPRTAKSAGIARGSGLRGSTGASAVCGPTRRQIFQIFTSRTGGFSPCQRRRWAAISGRSKLPRTANRASALQRPLLLHLQQRLASLQRQLATCRSGPLWRGCACQPVPSSGTWLLLARFLLAGIHIYYFLACVFTSHQRGQFGAWQEQRAHGRRPPGGPLRAAASLSGFGTTMHSGRCRSWLRDDDGAVRAPQ
ncbi:hypothetical protein GQ53DRAFT_39995 [Thozetella sp. PMI_491]|nr:hypothetical protein GQ53DRAFT_39995 [Thozetella sp. PMI_491]